MLKVRIIFTMMFFMVLFIALISRAFQLQVLSGQKLKQLAQKQHTTVLNLQPERGIIYDRNGEKLAVSIMADSVCADPSKMIDPVKTAHLIAENLGLDEQIVFKKLSSSKIFVGLPGEFLRSRRVCKKRKDRRNFSGQGTETVLSQWGTGRPFARLCRSGCGGLRGAGKKFDESLRGKPEKLAWARDAKGKNYFYMLKRASGPRMTVQILF